MLVRNMVLGDFLHPVTLLGSGCPPGSFQLRGSLGSGGLDERAEVRCREGFLLGGRRGFSGLRIGIRLRLGVRPVSGPAKQAGLVRRRRGGLRYERADKIRAAHDADNAAVPENGNALDPVGAEELSDLRNVRVLGYCYDRRRHDVPGCAFVAIHRGKKLGAQAFAFRQDGKPPVPARFAILLTEPQEIALAHHAGDLAIIVHYGDGANAVPKQQLRDPLRGRVRADRDDGGGHNVESIHVLPLPKFVSRRR